MAQHQTSIPQTPTASIVLRISVDDLPARLATLEEELEGGRRIELLRGGNCCGRSTFP